MNRHLPVLPKRSLTRTVLTSILLGTSSFSARISHAQTALATKDWLETYIASNGGELNPHRFYTNAMYDRTNSIYLYFSDVKKIELREYRGQPGHPSLVRLTGTSFSCYRIYPESEEEVRSRCSSGQGSMEVELNGSANSPENETRILKALTHLAELEGAKINQPDLF